MIRSDEMKQCGACGRVKSMNDFHPNIKKRDGRQAMCKECNREYCRDYRRKRRQNAEWQQHEREWETQDRAEEPIKYRFWDQNQYVRSRYPGTELGFSLSELTQMVKDSGYICEACGKDCKDSWTVDHRVKLSDGGEHTKANVRVLCLPCNSGRKHNGASDLYQPGSDKSDVLL